MARYTSCCWDRPQVDDPDDEADHTDDTSYEQKIAADVQQEVRIGGLPRLSRYPTQAAEMRSPKKPQEEDSSYELPHVEVTQTRYEEARMIDMISPSERNVDTVRCPGYGGAG
jgi:hypothetical protein